ncbi:MAG: hypothetical protein B7Z80_06675 [Rhodospirillales bacterium 20-64-7]|nr:MAG: hypothetical protein B7Z80_06675 [Rhodospirillales bacterium 20-64-7]
MKWFFCWCQETESRTDHDWPNLIRATVQSAAHTGLDPHMLYDGVETPFIAELRNRGVKVIFHRLSFADALSRHRPGDERYHAVARGAFLRFDIPLVCQGDDEFVLYTDADVMFRATPDFRGYRPDMIAAAPQFERGNRADMNSGVMLINLPKFRAALPGLVRFATENLALGLDQEVLRAWLGHDYLLLPDIYNWKPYWGQNADAPIVHWHGPKPVTVAELLTGGAAQHRDWQILFERDAQAYRGFVLEYLGLLATYGAADGTIPISRSKPARQSSLYRLPDGTAPFPPEAVVDGVLTGARKCHTAFEAAPWWQVDLGGMAQIVEIRVHNTTDATASRCRNLSLAVSIDGEAWAELAAKRDGEIVGQAERAYVWSGPGAAFGRFVRVTLLGTGYLHLAQVEVFGRLTT